MICSHWENQKFHCIIFACALGFTSCKVGCHQFLRSASLWEVEGSDINFCRHFDDNLWLGQGGFNPLSGVYDPFPVVLMEKSEQVWLSREHQKLGGMVE